MPLLRIDTDYLQDILKRLLAVPSPTGYTDAVVRETCRELAKLKVPFELTRRGAIRAKVEGKDHRGARGIVVHLDTLGAQVKRIKENGRLELVPIGTWSARFAEGARCTIFSEAGGYRGTILPLKSSGHTFNDEIDTAPIGWEHAEVRIDARTRRQRDTERLGIEIGDFVAIDPQSEFLDNGFIISRHLDNKAGVAVLLATLKAWRDSEEKPELPVDTYWLFTIAEEIGLGASSIIHPDVASLVAVDNGTTAPGQNSSEFGVTISMADQTGPFDYHLTKKLVALCKENEIRYQKDIFRYYKSDSAAAEVAGHDVRTALVTFGIDSSHGYERIHMHALRSLAELVTAYITSPINIRRDLEEISGLSGFTTQPMEEAPAGVSDASPNHKHGDTK
jgi:peptidase M42 family hydrolase